MSEYGPETPVPIFQHRGEFEQLLELYKNTEPMKVLEVGTYHGGTLYHWCQNAVDGATIVSVDSYQAGVDNRNLYGTWCREGVKVVAISGDSTDPDTIAAAESYGPFDWIFIDAGHYYHEVLADWTNYSKLAAPGATVCFHDILDNKDHHPEIDVRRLWLELKKDYLTEEYVVDPGNVWGGIGVLHMP